MSNIIVLVISGGDAEGRKSGNENDRGRVRPSARH